MSAALTTCPACNRTTPNDDCESCFPIAPPARCAACNGTGLALAVDLWDDVPTYAIGFVYCPRCDAGERLRAADRDHDLADDLDRGEIPCCGPVYTPRTVAGEPMGLEGMEV